MKIQTWKWIFLKTNWRIENNVETSVRKFS